MITSLLKGWLIAMMKSYLLRYSHLTRMATDLFNSDPGASHVMTGQMSWQRDPSREITRGPASCFVELCLWLVLSRMRKLTGGFPFSKVHETLSIWFSSTTRVSLVSRPFTCSPVTFGGSVGNNVIHKYSNKLYFFKPTFYNYFL